MYGVDPLFWLKLFFVLAIFTSLIFAFEAVMRRYLKVEKRKFFTYNHVNEKHKKIDSTIRISFLIILFILYIYLVSGPDKIIWYLQPGVLGFIFLGISEIVRAVMEWKYAVNRNAYIFTISQLIFNIMLLIILLWIVKANNFFGLFNV
ncbi:protein of unknown function [Desulfonispora thiosulfatigenes DSM 11270]|uniref:DUF4181 domain-containing protein n=1 Tax=Desulfonispora thiosulfatigenes DSM 11270 TaxID=656914 RepID=A0A1W1UZD9_DESTI|nr:protein of unknown function [Desulfonispora thiosulfatigenes DSM 11270]